MCKSIQTNAGLSSRKVLVTGASGFVGRHLISALSLQGYQIHAAAREPLRLPASAGVSPIAMADLNHPTDWRPLLTDIDIVIHLAGIAHRKATNAEHDRINYRATAELAGAAANAGVRHLIFISSVAAQTGPAAVHVITEADPPRPTSAYGIAKLKAEEAVAQSGAPFTILRPVVIAGDDAKGNYGTLQKLARLPLPLPVGALRNRRSILSIDNFCQAVLTVIRNPAALGQTFVLADPEAYTVGEIISEIRRRTGRSSGLLPVPPTLLRLGLQMAGLGALWERLGEPLVVSPMKLMELGWQPRE